MVSFRIFLLVSIGLIAATDISFAQRGIFEFPVQKCKYTVRTGGNWKLDKDEPGVMFQATNRRGIMVKFSTTVRTNLRLDESLFAQFDSKFFIPGKINKRSSSLLTFNGVDCIRLLWTLPDGRTGSTHCFIAHGYSYDISILGSKEPIELDPEYELILKGFEFTTPPPPVAPVPVQPEEDRAFNVSRLMGQIVGISILLIIVLVVLKLVFKKKAVKDVPATPQSEHLPE